MPMPGDPPRVIRRHSIRSLHKPPSSSFVLPSVEKNNQIHPRLRSICSSPSAVQEEQEDFQLRWTSLHFFQDFDQMTACKLIQLCTVRRLVNGDVVFQQDDPQDDNLYVVVEGNLQLQSSECSVPDSPLPIKKKDTVVSSEYGMISAGEAYGEHVFCDSDFVNTLHPCTAIVSSPSAIILCLSRAVVSQAGLMQKLLARVPSVMRRKRVDTKFRHGSDIALLPFFMLLQGHIKVLELTGKLSIQPASVEHRIVYMQDQYDDAKATIHVVLDGEVAVYYNASGVTATAAAAAASSSLDWGNQVLVEQVLGERVYTLGTGDAFGGPARPGPRDETHVLMPGAVIATAPRRIWQPFFNSTSVSVVGRAQLLRASLLALPPADADSDTVGSSATAGGPTIRDDVLDRLVETSGMLRQVPRARLAKMHRRLRLVRFPPGRPLCVQGSRLRGVFVLLFGSATVHSDDEDLCGPTADQRARIWAHRLTLSGVGNGLDDGSAAEASFGKFSCRLLPGDVTFERQLLLGSTPPRYCPATILAGSTHIEAVFLDAELASELVCPSDCCEPPAMLAPKLHSARVNTIELEDLLAVDRDRRSLSDLERISLLLPAFAELARIGQKELSQLARIATLRRFRAREPLLTADTGQLSRSWLAILRGSVSVHAALPNDIGTWAAAGSQATVAGSSREQVGRCLRVAGPGEMVGGLALLHNGSQSTTAMGRCDGACLAFEVDDLKPLVLANVRSSLQWPIFKAKSYVSGFGESRSEYEILCLTEFMRGNPFFRQIGIDDRALQELAKSVDISSLERGCELFEMANGIHHETKLIVVNKGFISTVPRASKAAPNAQQFRESLRYPVFVPGKPLGQPVDLSDSKGQGPYKAVGKGRRDLVSPKPGQPHGSRPQSGSRQHIDGNQHAREELGTNPHARPLSRNAPNKHYQPKKLDVLDPLLTLAHSWPCNGIGELESVAYGQAFWGSNDGKWHFIAGEDSECLIISRNRLKRIVSSSFTDEAQFMVSMMSKHPFFQSFSRSEIASLVSASRLVHLEKNSVLYRAGDLTSDIYMIKDGVIEMRVGLSIPKKSAEFCPGDPTHTIPSVLVSMLGQSSVVNDIPELLQRSGMDTITNTWLAHVEECTAISKEPTNILAIGKAQLISELRNQEKLDKIGWFVKSCTSFRWQRVSAIEKARRGMIYGDEISERKPILNQTRDICEVTMQFRKKKFATRQPPLHTFSPKSKGQAILEHNEHKKSDLEEETGNVLPGRLHVVKLPRNLDRRHFHDRVQRDSLEPNNAPGGSESRPFLFARPIVKQKTPQSPESDAAGSPCFVTRASILNAILSPRVDISRGRDRYFDFGKNAIISGINHREFDPRILATCQERSAGRAPYIRNPTLKTSFSPRRWFKEQKAVRNEAEKIPSLPIPKGQEPHDLKVHDWKLLGKQLRPRDVVHGRY